MLLTVRDLLDFDSLYESELIAGTQGLQKEVTGIMVMEAPDIEAWGNYGQVCLTSFFALNNLSTLETNAFFIKANQIGIAAFIVKLDRLVQEIPGQFIEECNQNQIPLIKIKKETKYENIILNVMETLINKNKILLDRYYDFNNQFTKMALSEPKIHDILSLLEDLILKPISFFKNDLLIYKSTDFKFDDFTVVRVTRISKQRYTNFEYQRQFVIYSDIPNQQHSQLLVDIPSLGEDVYSLLIHEFDQKSTEEEFMAIENTVSFLQMELLKTYALQQQYVSHLNEIMNDLIYGRYQSEEELLETLNFLGLTMDETFNLVIFDIYEESNNKEKWKDSATIANSLSNFIKIHWKKIKTLVKKNKIIFLISNSDSERLFTDKINAAIHSFTSLNYFSHISYNVAISNKSGVHQLPLANTQANNILKLLKQTNHKNKIVSYKDLGVIQLFLETNNYYDLIKFIPEKVLEIHKTNPELIKTLRVFLDHNQNFKITAKELFIHPKTAKYRIERLIQLANIDFEDPDELLQINIGLRLIEFIDQKIF